MSKIMIVDDDIRIRKPLRLALERRGYGVVAAANGPKAIAQFADAPTDLVVLDIMMPEMNGYEVCEELKKIDENVPVIFLSAKSDIVDKTLGFGKGADDYVGKPFEVEELILRIEAVLRRTKKPQLPGAAPSVALGNLTIDRACREVRVDGEAVSLTAKEYDIVDLMASYPGQVFSKEHLYERVWGSNYLRDDGTIAVYIKRIRQKIEANPKEPDHLLTVWGVGYRII